VDAALVRERAAPDVRRVLVEREVGDLGREPGDPTELGEPTRADALQAELELEVRDDRR
jgi:hypothetical protein